MTSRPLPALAAAAAALLLPAGADGQTASPPKPAELAPGVTFEVTEMRRLADKDVLQLKFVVANAGATPASAQNLGFATAYRLDNIQVIDFQNKRSYNIGTASRCLCSTFSDGGAVAPGQRREFWAWFALPPAGVRTVSVQVGDQPPMLDVPLQ